MKPYVTWTILEQNADALTMRLVEQLVTGPRAAYGYDTPIYLSNLISHLKASVLCGLLNYAEDSSINLQSIMAVELLRGYLSIWTSYTEGNTLPERIINYADEALKAMDDTVARYDYCGDLIQGSHADWAGRINDVQTELDAFVAMLDPLANPLKLGHNFWVTNGAAFTPADIMRWETMFDPPHWTIDHNHINETDEEIRDSGVIINYPGGYAAQVINSVMLPGPLYDIDHYLKESEVYYANPPTGTLWGMLFMATVDASGGTTGDPFCYAAQYFAQAIKYLNMMITMRVPMLWMVTVLLERALVIYNSGMRWNLQQLHWRLASLVNDAAFQRDTFTGNPTISAAENGSVEAGRQRRAALLRDAVYIRSFDANNDGVLSESERKTMEIDVRKKVLAARQSYAANQLVAAQAEYDALDDDGLEIILKDIMLPYFL